MTRMRITQQLTLSPKRDIEIIGHGSHLHLTISRVMPPGGVFGSDYQTAVLTHDEVNELHLNLGEWLEENRPDPEESNPDIRDAQPRS